MNPSVPEVSVVITTRNEEANIRRCLESVRNQQKVYGKAEVIVVDNNSADNTKEIATLFTDKIYNCGPERSAQRNLGIAKASGRYILYLDADMILSENLIAEALEKCAKGEFIALYIPERIIGKGFWSKVRDFERSFYNATSIDAVRFVNRDAALGIRCFDEDLTGPEDWDFNRRIEAIGKTGITENVIYHNEGRFDLVRYLKKKAYYAGSFDTYVRKWGRDDPIVRKQLGAYYRFVGVFTENGKWKRLFCHPMLALAMYALRISVGLFSLKSILSRSVSR